MVIHKKRIKPFGEGPPGHTLPEMSVSGHETNYSWGVVARSITSTG